VRSFASIPIPPAELSGLPAPAESHLTLRFWAELSEDRRGIVEEALVAAAARSLSFGLELRGVGAFPSSERPRVVWVGVGRGGENLRGLHRALEEELAQGGESAQPRAFHPHVTLFRVRSSAALARAHSALEAGRERSFGEVTVDRLELYASRLEPGGAVHELLRSASLVRGGEHLPAEPHA
jgi:RNA 2',3'-cyclic 3'-phosphodiesterase